MHPKFITIGINNRARADSISEKLVLRSQEALATYERQIMAAYPGYRPYKPAYQEDTSKEVVPQMYQGDTFKELPPPLSYPAARHYQSDTTKELVQPHYQEDTLKESVLTHSQSGPIPDQNTQRRTYQIICHDRLWRDAYVADATGNKLFSLEAPAGILSSWSIRRSLRNNSGNHIWTLRHYHSHLNQWTVETADGSQICHIQDEKRLEFVSLSARMPGGGSNMRGTMTLHSQDISGLKATFANAGEGFGEMVMVTNNDVMHLDRRGLDRTAWRLEVGGEVDMGVVLAMAFVRIEIAHAKRR